MTERQLQKIATALAPWHDHDELDQLVNNLRADGLAGEPVYARWKSVGFAENGVELYIVKLSDHLGDEVVLMGPAALDEACAKCASLKEELGVETPELPKELG